MNSVWIQWIYTSNLRNLLISDFIFPTQLKVLLNKILLSTVYTHVAAVKYNNITQIPSMNYSFTPHWTTDTAWEFGVCFRNLRKKTLGHIILKSILKWPVGIQRHSQYCKTALAVLSLGAKGSGKQEEELSSCYWWQMWLKAWFCPPGRSGCFAEEQIKQEGWEHGYYELKKYKK